MNDRISLYPGRVTLTPVAGQANTYDLVRADSPTQEGTPLNKASLLKDTTAALYGLTASAVPDEVLAAIKPLIDEANANANTRAKSQAGSYAGTGIYGSSSPCSLTFDFEPKMLVVSGPSDETNETYFSILVKDSMYAVIGLSNAGEYTFGYLRATFEGQQVSWYIYRGVGSTRIAAHQLNKSGKIYKYVAIG